MDTYRQRFEELREEIHTWEQAAEDPETIEAARQQRKGVMATVNDLLDDSAYRRYVVQHLSEAADSDRRDCCTCADPYCAVKRGKLPAQVELAETIDEGITAFAADHPGEPKALLEARTDRLEEAEAAEEQLMRSVTTLKRDEGEAFVPGGDAQDSDNADDADDAPEADNTTEAPA